MKLKLPKTYKLLLALCVVAGPFTWLVLTEDGKRRSDLFLLHLLGHQPFNLAVANLRPGLDKDVLLGQFPRLAFHCLEAPTELGERHCEARIGSFNGIPARQAQLDWKDDALTAVRIDYRGRWHEVLIEAMTMRLGAPRRDRVDERTILAWRLDEGMLLAPEQLIDEEPPVLIWIAQQD